MKIVRCMADDFHHAYRFAKNETAGVSGQQIFSGVGLDSHPKKNEI